MDDAPSPPPPRRLALAPGADAPGQGAPASAGSASGAAPGASSGQVSLWHVSVTFAGPRVPRQQLHAALVRLVEAQPFPATVRYNDERAEISYWDEAEDVDDAAALGLRLWAEHRRTADLPGWRAVGIEVVDRETLRARGERTPPPRCPGRRQALVTWQTAPDATPTHPPVPAPVPRNTRGGAVLVALVMSATGANEPAEHTGIPPLLWGLMAFAVFLSLLAILWAFRSVGNRH